LSRFEKVLIEDAPIDDNGFDSPTGIRDLPAGRRPEQRSFQLVEDGRPGQLEFIKRFSGEDSCAVYGLPDFCVLLQNFHVEPGLCQAPGGMEAGGAPAYDQRIAHRGHSNRFQASRVPKFQSSWWEP
jgi:hypothetical protein